MAKGNSQKKMGKAKRASRHLGQTLLNTAQLPKLLPGELLMSAAVGKLTEKIR